MTANLHALPSARPESVERYAEAEIPTVRGPIRCIVYREAHPAGLREHAVLIAGEVNPDDLLVRVHSECITSEVFGSMKCDCREQLEAALDRITDGGGGAVLYLRQEGRGIGLGNKIRAYALQSEGLDTVDANHQLGFETDLREYRVAAEMLADLGIRGVSLMTNNPDKISGLEAEGIKVNRRVPLEIEPNDHSEGYLNAKRERLGHLLNVALNA